MSSRDKNLCKRLVEQCDSSCESERQKNSILKITGADDRLFFSGQN